MLINDRSILKSIQVKCLRNHYYHAFLYFAAFHSCSFLADQSGPGGCRAGSRNECLLSPSLAGLPAPAGLAPALLLSPAEGGAGDTFPAGSLHILAWHKEGTGYHERKGVRDIHVPLACSSCSG